jgi:hypothetical protein
MQSSTSEKSTSELVKVAGARAHATIGEIRDGSRVEPPPVAAEIRAAT